MPKRVSDDSNGGVWPSGSTGQPTAKGDTAKDSNFYIVQQGRILTCQLLSYGRLGSTHTRSGPLSSHSSCVTYFEANATKDVDAGGLQSRCRIVCGRTFYLFFPLLSAGVPSPRSTYHHYHKMELPTVIRALCKSHAYEVRAGLIEEKGGAKLIPENTLFRFDH